MKAFSKIAIKKTASSSASRSPLLGFYGGASLILDAKCFAISVHILWRGV